MPLRGDKIHQMDLNSYKITNEPNEVFSCKVDGINSYDDLEKLDNNVCSFSGGRVFSLNKLETGKDISEENYKKLKRNVKHDLLKKLLCDFLKQKGLVEVSNDRFIYPLGSSISPRKLGDIFLNYGFQIEINPMFDGLHLFIDPKLFVTRDGNSYDSDFTKNNYGYLSQNQLSYPDFLKIIKNTFGLLGDNFKIVTESGEFDFTKDPELSNDSILSTGEEPKISFGGSKSHDFPAAGLKRWGPWDYNESVDSHPSEIEFGIIGKGFSLPLLRDIYRNPKKGPYEFSGFENVYHTKLKHDKDKASIDFSEDELMRCKDKDELSKLIKEKARYVFSNSDVAVVELPKSALNIPYANVRDFLKILFWEEKLPTQFILEGTSSNTHGIIDNFALGLYVAAGGKPWVLESPISNHIFIGISFGISPDKTKLIGIFEVFDGYGLSLDMEVTELKESNNKINEADMHLSSSKLKEVIKSAIIRYSEKFNGNHPEKVVIHKTTYFDEDELSVVDKLDEFQVDIGLVYINSYGSGIHIIPSSGNALPKRRNYFKLFPTKALLYTKGLDSYGRTFDNFIPEPIIVEVYQSERSKYDIDQACLDIIKLTKLNWNSVASYEREPVTISHSRKIVKLLREGLSLDNIPTSIRYFV